MPDRPGRGIGPHRAHHLVGVPRIDGRNSADGLSAGLADLVARVARAWSGPPAPPVRLLPRVVELDRLRSTQTRDLVIGLEGSRLGTVALDQRTDPGLLRETIRVELRRFFKRRSGRRPLVLPVVMEL